MLPHFSYWRGRFLRSQAGCVPMPIWSLQPACYKQKHTHYICYFKFLKTSHNLLFPQPLLVSWMHHNPLTKAFEAWRWMASSWSAIWMKLQKSNSAPKRFILRPPLADPKLPLEPKAPTERSDNEQSTDLLWPNASSRCKTIHPNARPVVVMRGNSTPPSVGSGSITNRKHTTGRTILSTCRSTSKGYTEVATNTGRVCVGANHKRRTCMHF